MTLAVYQCFDDKPRICFWAITFFDLPHRGEVAEIASFTNGDAAAWFMWAEKFKVATVSKLVRRVDNVDLLAFNR